MSDCKDQAQQDQSVSSELSILQGETRPMVPEGKKYPLLVHRVFEHTLRRLVQPQLEEIYSIDLTGRTPEGCYIEFEGKRTTMIQLNKAANRIAHALLNKLQEDGRRKVRNADGDAIIGACMERSDIQLTVVLAVLKTGAAIQPMALDASTDRCQHIIQDCQPLLYIVDTKGKDKLEKLSDVPLVNIKDLLREGLTCSTDDVTDEESLYTGCPYRHVAYIIYTSGTTGKPKGVRVPHHIIIHRQVWELRHFPFFDGEDMGIEKAAYNFLDVAVEIFPFMFTGRSLFITSEPSVKNPETLINIYEKVKVRRTILVVSLFRSILLCLDQNEKKKTADGYTTRLKDLTIWFITSEPMTNSVAIKFFELFDEKHVQLYFAYGCTENSADVCWHRVIRGQVQDAQKRLPIGKPLDNHTLYLMDEEQHPVPLGEVGELYISGTHLALGYVRNACNNTKFIDLAIHGRQNPVRMYRSGDFGRMVDGLLVIEGRRDSQVKVRGHRVDLLEVEVALEKVPGVEQCVVICYKPGDSEQNILGYFTSSTVDERFVQMELQKNLASYMVPKAIKIDGIPHLVSSGKIDRLKLSQIYADKMAAAAGHVDKSALDYTEISEGLKHKAKVLFETIAVLLKAARRATITLSSNFFELGGDSLNSILLVTKLKDRGMLISVQDFLDAKTLKDVLEHMEADKSKENIVEELKVDLDEKYTIEALQDSDRQEALSVYSECFAAKDELMLQLATKVSAQDYFNYTDKLWKKFVDNKYSFKIKDNEGNIQAVCFNQDLADEVDVDLLEGGLKSCFQATLDLEFTERSKAKPGETLHLALGGTKLDNDSLENVKLFIMMGRHCEEIGRQHGFQRLLTTDVNTFVMQLDVDVLGYKEVGILQLNTYVDQEGNKPFINAPDTAHIIMVEKSLI